MNLIGVGGRPVLHSKSPLVHAHILGRAGCRSVRVGAESAEELAGLIRSANFRGLNVTAPFKRDILPYLDDLDVSAASSGAVNTVVHGGGRLVGFNTDPEGVLFALHRRGIDPAGRRALVLGAGGAGRSAASALALGGGHVTIANRTDDRAESCAADYHCDWMPFSRWGQCLDAFDILVNTVPLSSGVAEALRPQPHLVILDALYTSRPFADAAGRRGCVYIPGEEWLFGQALASCRLWGNIRSGCIEPGGRLFKPPFSPDKIRRVSLIGIMGAGKSTVGRLLARMLDRPFIDTDVLASEREGMPIPDIFRVRGENTFRAVETEVLQRALRTPAAVLATGGGAVLRHENRETLRRNSIVVWIHADPEAALKRIAGSGRPLLAGITDRRKFIDLCGDRRPLYAATADLMVGAEKHPENTARIIHENICQTFGD